MIATRNQLIAAISLTVFLVTLTANSGTTAPEFKISSVRDKVGSLTIGPKAQAALRAAFPGFVPFEAKDFIHDAQTLFKNKSNESMSAEVGHFTSKEVPDLIVMGHYGKNQVIAAVIPSGTGFKVVTIDVADYIDPSTATFSPTPENANTNPSSAEQEGRNEQPGLGQYLSRGEKCHGLDTFQVETFYVNADRYYYDPADGKFKLMDESVARGCHNLR